ncbi:ABC transporter ATP-binding protein/permease [Atopobium minutum]|uniref:ABC transporter ATP-binding protein/permease n=1 Tax=Atopobium minutum TaxID=1381 RepID=UPI001D245248|nr:ABC transporter ATP-binding protein/permease [Atopobium minutum]MBS4874082.1 ABC transporter ATP-binding protein/permease [Atopobium minutum]MDU5130581.1 ABC transporter ATP-binding protein/permease [Atopobium minutum]MDU5357700.1 ABC transporter ATP-binding protein/permease [Atopobium minutum]MDU5893011.1 ABC transporter ATP-binding protein/permease [Atopobium minutum]
MTYTHTRLNVCACIYKKPEGTAGMFDKRLLKLCQEARLYIAGNIFFQWVELLLNAAMIYVISNAVQRLYLKSWGTQELLRLVLIIICFTIARFATTKLATKMSYLASRNVKKTLREKIYKKLLALGGSWHDKVNTAELVQESVEGVEQLENYFGLYLPQFFYAFLAPITLFVLFGLYGSWTVGAILLVCVPLIPGAIMIVQKIAKKLLSTYWDQYTQLGSTFLENLQGMTTLKTYQADAWKNEQMNAESEHFRKVTMAVLTMQLNSIIVMDFLAYGGAALGIILIVKSFMDGSLSLASGLFMILLSADFFLPMRKLGSYFHIAMNGMAASDKIFTFLDQTEPKQGTQTVCGRNISVKNLGFSYDGKREVLHGIDMEIPEQSFIGIVGKSGSGKSTLARLLMRRSHPTSGEIQIDKTPLEAILEESLMETITYLGFGSVFFKGTVYENLALAMTKPDEKRMWQVLHDCQLDAFLHTQDGLQTQLLENASNLSGGQRQRLALARAILHDTPIYIFDEATSNIDIESEEAILDEIRRMAQSKTVIMISHRLANVVFADTIYCMDQGTIVESGTHNELLKQNVTYAGLWETQQMLEQYGKEAL